MISKNKTDFEVNIDMTPCRALLKTLVSVHAHRRWYDMYDTILVNPSPIHSLRADYLEESRKYI